MSLQSYRIQQLPIDSSKDRDAIFNASYLVDIPEALASWDCRRVLLVVSKALDSNTDIVKRLEEKLGQSVVGKKVGVGSHTPYSDMIDIVKILNESKADAVVSVGSSSYSDACKTALLIQATVTPQDLSPDAVEALVDREHGITTSGTLKPRRVKLIVLPTSLSASEWNPISSCTSPSGKKQHFGDFELQGSPDLIVLDPKVAATSPETLWLSSGFRAIDHCVETICNRTSNDDANKNAEDALRKLIRGLKGYKECKAAGEVGHDQDLELKLFASITECQMGARQSMLGVLVWGIYLGPSHAIGHQLGGTTGMMHGFTSCIILSHVLRYTESQLPQMQRRVLNAFNSAFDRNEENAADGVREFVRFLGLPTTLSEEGVTDDDVIRDIARKTMTDAIKVELKEEEILTILMSAK